MSDQDHKQNQQDWNQNDPNQKNSSPDSPTP